MYRTILVPLDGSKRAERILPHAGSLAKHYRSEIVFLKVEEEPVLLGWDEVVDQSKAHTESEARRKQNESYLMEQKDNFQKEGIETQIRIAYGPVVKAIVNTANEIDSDLIALASHGLSASPRMSYGSVAAGLLQAIDRPLFIIRSQD